MNRSPTPSAPWHRGELEAQRRAGVDPRQIAAMAGFQRNYLTEQHRAFYPRLPFLVVGAVDREGRPWATILDGVPGFLQAVDEHHLQVGAHLDAEDPASDGLRVGDAVGLLGIELETRRRNRLNGHVVEASPGQLSVAVDRAYGNCPQYIHTRDLRFEPEDPRHPAAAERGDTLDDEARSAIERSSMFFVASYAQEPDRAVDVSHRGGRPGFVDVDGDQLTIPDFFGNQFFNTLGNFLVNPKAGLLFPDFMTGDVLQLSGSVEVSFDSSRAAAFEGALRLWIFRVERMVRRRAVLRWRGAIRDPAAETEETGTWAEAHRRRALEARHGWRRLRVVSVVDEADDVRSFVLKPSKADDFEPGRGGMHLVLRLPAEDGSSDALIRSYSLSRMPADGAYRIGVKRAGAGSREIWRRLREGVEVEAHGPQGEFVADLASHRPVVLLSVGIGITPMMALAEEIVDVDLDSDRPRPIHFIHGARHGGSMAFRDDLVALEARAAGQLTVTRLFSQPRDVDRRGVGYEIEGHLTIDVLRQVMAFDDDDFYLCGPGSFMQQMYDGLRALGIADDRIHAETFGPSSLRRAATGGFGAVDEERREPATVATPVFFARSGKAATWLPGSGSLLELAERCGLDPEFGCRIGSCGTCRTSLLGGEVAYPGRIAPPGADHSALICCAVPASHRQALPDRLVLDL